MEKRSGQKNGRPQQKGKQTGRSSRSKTQYGKGTSKGTSNGRKYSSSKGTAKRKKKAGGQGLISGFITVIAVICICTVGLIGILIEKGVIDGNSLSGKLSDMLFGEKTEILAVTPDDSFDFGVYYLDIGQGDSELITSGDVNVLIDAGEVGQGDRVVAILKEIGIKKLDYIIATHPHSDHIGGMPEVIKTFDVGKIIAPKIPEQKIPASSVYENFLDAVADKGKKLTAARVGAVYQLGEADLEIIAPLGDSYDDLNNFSVVCRVTYGKSSFLFTGDAEKPSEKEIAEKGTDIKSDVYKVGHHGSKNSSTDRFLELVRPSVAVISCGEGNSYGHPTKEALSRLEGYTKNIYRTDINGTIVIYSDKNQLYIKTERQAS